MLLFIYLFLFSGVTLILWAVSASLKDKAIQVKLPAENRQEFKRKKLHSFLSGIFPFSRVLLEKLKLDVKLKNLLDAGHVKLNPQEFLNIKLLLMVVLVISVLFLTGKSDPPIILLTVGLGFILPDLWLRRRISQRKYIILRTLPETMDLLGLCVEAGLDFTNAVSSLIEKKASSGPLIEEFTLVLEEIKWGKPRSQALKDMAKRLNMPEVSSFVQALVQAERMGTPVNETFTIISEDARLQRFRRGERFALKAPIKILIPLIFCILPVIAIIIGGPILLQFMQGSLFKGF